MEPKADRTWIWLGLGFAALWLGYLMFFSPRSRNNSAGAFAEGQPVDYRWEVEDLEGKPVDLAKYKGKAVFLNVWATWCGPCVREIPSITRLAANPKVKDVAFVCVSVDDDLQTVRQFVNEHDLKLTVLHAKGPPPALFETDGIPTTFFLSPDGRAMKREVGAMEWDQSDAADALEKLARQAPKKS
jgi:thiol-disulfide isomerase/thioredoxin